MAVRYDRDLRTVAKREGLHLVTVAAEGCEFQGAVTLAERAEVMGLLKRLLRAQAGAPELLDRAAALSDS